MSVMTSVSASMSAGTSLRSIRAPPLRPQRQHSAEIHHMIASNLFSGQQRRLHFGDQSGSQIKSFMRRRVAEWMLKTADRFRSAPYVFAHAMILLDNYLGTTLSCTPETLQLLGASALLLAGKCVDSVQSLNLSLPILCASADDAFTVNELKTMELRLLQSVNWNPLDLKKPHDYVEECLAILYELPVLVPLLPRIERNTCVYIDISYLDHALPTYGPETIAAAALQFATSAEDAMGLIQTGNAADGNSILKLGIFSADTRERFATCVCDLYTLLNTFGLCSLAPQWMEFFDARNSTPTVPTRMTVAERAYGVQPGPPSQQQQASTRAVGSSSNANVIVDDRTQTPGRDEVVSVPRTYVTRSAAVLCDARAS